MGAADRAHEIDDHHDHQAWRDDLHTEGDRSTALGTDDCRASRDNDEKKCTPYFCENTPPLMSGFQEIGHSGYV
jgi:hypothetical protein